MVPEVTQARLLKRDLITSFTRVVITEDEEDNSRAEIVGQEVVEAVVVIVVLGDLQVAQIQSLGIHQGHHLLSLITILLNITHNRTLHHLGQVRL